MCSSIQCFHERWRSLKGYRWVRMTTGPCFPRIGGDIIIAAHIKGCISTSTNLVPEMILPHCLGDQTWIVPIVHPWIFDYSHELAIKRSATGIQKSQQQK